MTVRTADDRGLSLHGASAFDPVAPDPAESQLAHYLTMTRLDALNDALVRAKVLDPAALEANRSGLLTPEQVLHVRGRRRARGGALLVIGALCLAVGGWNLLPGQPNDDRLGAFMSVLLGGVLIALRFTDLGRSHSAELAAGRLSFVDGFVRVRAMSGDNHTSYWYQLDGREFSTHEDAAKAIDARARYRVYCLPDSEIMVNIEAIGAAVAGPLAGPVLLAEEIAAIVCEPMRAEPDTVQVGSGAWPGTLMAAFTGAASGLHVGVRYWLGGRDGPVAVVYRNLLGSGAASRPVVGLGDEAIYCGGRLLARRGETLVCVSLVNLQDMGTLVASDRTFDVAQRIARLALKKLQ